MIRRILGVLDSVSFLAPLLTRLVIGHAFFLTGKGKLANLERTTAVFADLGIPMPAVNATFIAGLETVGGLLLIAGLATRPAAALLACTMVVAILTAHREDFLKALGGDLTDIAALMFLLFLIWLVLHGPGKMSVDEWIARKMGLASGTLREGGD